MFSCFKGPRTEDQAQGVASPVPSSEGKSLPYWPQCRSQKLYSLQQQRIKIGNKDRTEWKVVAGDTSWGTSRVEQENCQDEAPSPFRNQNQHRATLNSCNFFGFYVVTCYLLVPVTRKKKSSCFGSYHGSTAAVKEQLYSLFLHASLTELSAETPAADSLLVVILWEAEGNTAWPAEPRLLGSQAIQIPVQKSYPFIHNMSRTDNETIKKTMGSPCSQP